MTPTGARAPQHCRLMVLRETDVPHVVAAARQFCTDNGLSPIVAAHVATSASELANNLWMHAARGGSIALQMHRHPRVGVELVATDDGPGIADIALALREGYSTGGGLGCGLPGVQRLMDEFEIQSHITPCSDDARAATSAGTVVRARKWAAPAADGPVFYPGWLRR